jgi:hypothetical protein
MSRWADWIPISPDDADQFSEAWLAGDETVNELLEPLLDSNNGASELDMDKLWEPIHRCLTGDYAPAHELNFEAGESPLNLAILGGEQLLEEGYRTLSLVTAEDVPRVAQALASVSKAWFRERFMALPNNQYHEITEDMGEWVWRHVEQLAKFYASAACQGCAVLCTISH